MGQQWVKAYAKKAWDKAVECKNAVVAVVTGAVVVGHEAVYAADISMPIDFAELATDGMTVVTQVLGAIATIIITIALVRMGFRYPKGRLSGTSTNLA